MARQDQGALKTVEALILAQAVWEHGANAWQAVSKTISSHPLISRPKLFFTAQSSQAMYQSLMNDAGLQHTDNCNIVHSPINHELAEKYYRARFEELRDLIITEETKFKTILSDIEAIRSGNFDAEIGARITGIPVAPKESKESVEESKISEPTLSDELFGGSDLTGATDTPASPQLHDTTSVEVVPTHEASQLSSEQTLEADTSLIDGGYVHSGIVCAADQEDNQDSPIHKEITDLAGGASSDIKMSDPLTSLPSFTPYIQPKEQEKESVNVGREPDRIDEGRERAISKEIGEVEDQGKRDEAEDEDVTVQTSSEGFTEDVDVSESRATTLEPTVIQREVPSVYQPRGPSPESPTVAEVEPELHMDDGESSGDEPLHVSRRSTRRQRSTLSPVQPLQTRGKGRRQRAESPTLESKDEPEGDDVDEIEEINEETAEVDSPAPIDSSRRWEGKRKTSFAEGTDSFRERKRLRDDSEPVDEDDSGPNSQARGRRPGTRSEEQVALKRFQNVIGMLHSQISQHRNGNIFHNPIKNSEAPDYHEIVKRPIDLKTIKMKVKDGSIVNSLEYQRDIHLMFANAMMYNRPGSDVYMMAEDMMIQSEGHILAFRQTEGLVRGTHRP